MFGHDKSAQGLSRLSDVIRKKQNSVAKGESRFAPFGQPPAVLSGHPCPPSQTRGSSISRRSKLKKASLAADLSSFGSGGRIRTSDLWVMSPTSYRTAPPRDKFCALIVKSFANCPNDCRVVVLFALQARQIIYTMAICFARCSLRFEAHDKYRVPKSARFDSE